MQAIRLIEIPAPANLPSIVYRVDYEGSQTSFSPTKGFCASNTRAVIATTPQLHFFASAHFNWASNISSPFISVFADNNHAERWARGFSERNGGKKCYVVRIDTAALGRGPIFRAADLLTAGVESPMHLSQHFSEYLIMYRIPITALVDEIIVSVEPQEQSMPFDHQLLRY
ncbi:hypothetical protein K432DRAFT_402201 [Lepidopterella palustris CBS 459.81]|uniref:DUF7587 domain-containing protein n=1 Tax=Lepidopterella palustris CBS 459.81 TaxID=1314670 RepID=A0A8E2EFS9_9PEZI|nr:hypothetical protein K432DRAFT_402201 [Lepidopterella palustris CBS 459.81]